MRALHPRRHGESSDAGFNRPWFVSTSLRSGEMRSRLLAGLCGRRGIGMRCLVASLDPGSLSFLLGYIEKSEHCAHRVTHAFLDQQFLDRALAEGGHTHGRLVGFYLDYFLISDDLIADLNV